ncbi:MAG TPA: SpoIID/LytB domain-containing protein [Vicinamibacterales bacterium]
MNAVRSGLLIMLFVAGSAGVDDVRPWAESSEPASQPPASDLPAMRVGILKPGGGYAISTLSVDAYVARVVAGEAARESRPAALEALAIAVRTFAQANRGRHRADGFDVCDQTHCQVVRNPTQETEAAAQATAGKILLHDGAAASIYYTASCGGRTEKPSAVWPGAEDPPFLPSRDDDACQGAPAWTANLQTADLFRALRAAGFRGSRLTDMRIASRTGSGRVAQLEVAGVSPREISGQDLRVAVGRTLGWQHIKSTSFDLRKQGDYYRFAGHGSGHGVGMCVIGSAKLAEQGRTADEILARYYPGLPIGRLGSGVVTTTAGASSDQGRRDTGAVVRRQPSARTGVALALPDEDEGGHVVIEKQTLAARDELAAVLGVMPPRVTLRFHSTTDEFELATGRSWFSSIAAFNDELHLIPVMALRERGVLDQTIRRGLVHLMVDGPLKDRPAWVREGATLYYSDPKSAAPLQGRLSCPTDIELIQPVSAGALTNAFARAKACFARQVGSGRSWRDVR